MSEWKAEVFRLGKFGKHPNADSLSIYQYQNYPVIFRTGDFQEGDLVAYVPIDSIVPNTPEWDFLGDHKRIKAKKLRGIFSMGLLTKAPEGSQEGELVNEKLGLVKYEPALSVNTGGENEHDPGFLPKYDMEGLRKYPNVFQVGEEVVITEKIHGANARYCWKDDRLWVGSHNTMKKENKANVFWKMAYQYNLVEILKQFPNKIFYGEVYGWVQSLRYGHNANEQSLVWFDVFDIDKGRFLDYDDFVKIVLDMYRLFVAEKIVPVFSVPVLYTDGWSDDLKSLANGKSIIVKPRPIDNIREGFVVKPRKERWDNTIGRVVLKLHGEEYLLSKYN